MDAPNTPHDVNAASRRLRALLTPCVSLASVEELATRKLPASEIRDVGHRFVRHLLRGCPTCAVTLGKVAGMREVVPVLPSFRYDFPVVSGIRNAMRTWRGEQTTADPRPLKSFEQERSAALLAEARELRRDNPRAAIGLLEEALRHKVLADASRVADESGLENLAVEIHTERGNIFRLLGQHPEAELAFQTALAAWEQASGSAEALLNLGDLYGSLLIDLRRFAEADLLFARLSSRFKDQGDAARAAKLTVLRTQAAIYANDLERALRYSLEAFRLLRDTDLLEMRLNAAQHTIALNVQLGDFKEASDGADAIRAQYQRHMGAGDRAKFLWLDAQIYSGLRLHGVADGLFRRAKAQFEQIGLPFQAALVGLDLAVRLVETRRSSEARELITSELVYTFRSVGVAREGLASLILLERATEANVLDAALLKSVLRDLERAGQALGPKRSETDEGAEASDFE